MTRKTKYKTPRHAVNRRKAAMKWWKKQTKEYKQLKNREAYLWRMFDLDHSVKPNPRLDPILKAEGRLAPCKWR